MPKAKRQDKKKQPDMSTRRLVFSPDELDKIEKLAMLGLPLRDIGWIMGLQPKQWEDVLGRDRAELKAGNQRRDNLIQIIERGRNDGRLALAKTAFEMAVKDKDSKVLLHLLKTRLKLVEEQQVNLKGRVVFETQIGDDGVIRSSETPDDEEEGETWGT